MTAREKLFQELCTLEKCLGYGPARDCDVEKFNGLIDAVIAEEREAIIREVQSMGSYSTPHNSPLVEIVRRIRARGEK